VCLNRTNQKVKLIMSTVQHSLVKACHVQYGTYAQPCAPVSLALIVSVTIIVSLDRGGGVKINSKLVKRLYLQSMDRWFEPQGRQDGFSWYGPLANPSLKIASMSSVTTIKNGSSNQRIKVKVKIHLSLLVAEFLQVMCKLTYVD